MHNDNDNNNYTNNNSNNNDDGDDDKNIDTIIIIICNNIFYPDWFSARLFVTQSARHQVGVELQVSSYNKLSLETCYWIPT